ncbi:hypothetical protein D3C80_1984600 [compost metagenome]
MTLFDFVADSFLSSSPRKISSRHSPLLHNGLFFWFVMLAKLMRSAMPLLPVLLSHQDTETPARVRTFTRFSVERAFQSV